MIINKKNYALLCTPWYEFTILNILFLSLSLSLFVRACDSLSRLIIKGGGSAEQQFLRATPGSIFNQLYLKFLNSSEQRQSFIVPDATKGLQLLTNTRRGTYYYIRESIESMDEYKCAVSPTWMNSYPELVSMAVPKQSPFRDVMKLFLIQHLEGGFLDMLNARWQNSRSHCVISSNDPGQALGKEKIVSLFFMMSLGMAMALISFAVECAWNCFGTTRTFCKTTMNLDKSCPGKN